MLEEKIEDLKHEQDVSQTTTLQHPRISTKIDINIAASLPDSYFLSETDKLNFYREIESLEDISDLEYLKENLLSQSEDI
jgi:transcription-repair coupling factor (superfamily II helicase)